jgi:outer membrane protein TolC
VRSAVIRWVLAPAVFLPVAGCAVGPNFVPPEAPIAEKFRFANNHSVKSTYKEYPDWWKSFHDPILNRLIHTAFNQNLTLLAAGTRVLQARDLGDCHRPGIPTTAARFRVADLQSEQRRHALGGAERDPCIFLDRFGWHRGRCN